MNRLLLSDRSVFVVVFSAARFLEDRAEQKARLRDWIQSVRASAPAAKVIVVGTHIGGLSHDALRDVEDGVRSAVRDFRGVRLMWIENKPQFGRAEGIGKLRDTLMSTADCIFKEIQSSAGLVEAQLLKRRDEGILWLPRSDFEELLAPFAQTPADAPRLVDMLSHLGAVLISARRDIVVLDPVALVTRVIKYFLPAPGVVVAQRKAHDDALSQDVLREWLEFRDPNSAEDFGVQRASSRLINAVVRLVNPRVSNPQHGWKPEHVLDIMADYHLCARIPDHVHGTYYLFPSILMDSAETGAAGRLRAMADPNPLLPMRHELYAKITAAGAPAPLTPTLFRVLVARLLERWRRTETRPFVAYKDGIFFAFQEAELAVVLAEGGSLTATVCSTGLEGFSRVREELIAEIEAVVKAELAAGTCFLETINH